MRTLIFVFYASFLLFLSAPAPAFSQDVYGKGIQEIRIELPYPGWDKKLDSIKNVNPEARLLGSTIVNGVRYDSVGVRYKGNSSYFRSRKETFKKLPINVKLDFRIKTQKLKEGHTTLKLSNAFLDPSFIRDPLAYQIIRKYMPAPRCNFSKVYINDLFYGVYVNTESIDAKFLEKHFGTTTGFLVKCDPDSWKAVRSQSGCPKGENASLMYLNDSPGCYDAFYEVDNPASWKPLLNLIKVLNRTPDQIEKVLDVDQTLWMHAINNAIVNLDSYTGSLSHNYYLWIDTTGVGHPLIWDLNMAFGGWRRNFSFEQMSDDEIIRYSPMAEFDNPKRPLISKVLRTPLFRKLYIAHYRTIIRDFLEKGEWLNEAQAMIKEIDPWVKKDSVKLYSYQDFQQSLDKTMVSGPDKIIGLRQLMDQRAQFLLTHPVFSKAPPTISDVKHSKKDDQILITAKLANADAGWLFYRTDKMFAFTRTSMNDSGANGDATAGDGIFSASVPAAQAKQYYVAGENANAAATFPERASYEYLKVEAPQ